MRREGSPWTGLMTVFSKETADNLTSIRIWILEGIVLIAAGVTVYTSIGELKDTVSQDAFIYLRLFTAGAEKLPSLLVILTILIPIAAIALGFDTINTEYTRRTMSRILAQPIYRDALLFGKFLAGLTTLSVCFITLWLLVIGLGILMVGLPPSGEEIVRSVGFLVVAIAYGGVWLAIAMLFSTMFRQPVTSVLAALGVWLFFAFLWPMATPLLSTIIAGPAYTPLDQLAIAETELALSRVSPNALFGEATVAMLTPETRALGPVFFSQLQGMIRGAPLPFVESLLLVWPQITGLIAPVILLFALTYVIFQRQEVRA
jgi:ABC-2 type transport system permease protein